MTRRQLFIIVTVCVGFNACMSCGCTTAKTKQSRNITTDSTYRSVKIDSSTVLHKYEGSSTANDKYERITTITPTIIHDKDTFIIRPTTIIREVGERLVEVRYVDSSVNQVRVLQDELASLQKQVNEKNKEKETGWPWWWFLVILIATAGVCWFMFKRRV